MLKGGSSCHWRSTTPQRRKRSYCGRWHLQVPCCQVGISHTPWMNSSLWRSSLGTSGTGHRSPSSAFNMGSNWKPVLNAFKSLEWTVNAGIIKWPLQSPATFWVEVLSRESILESSCTTDPVQTALAKFETKHLHCRSLRFFEFRSKKPFASGDRVIQVTVLTVKLCFTMG